MDLVCDSKRLPANPAHSAPILSNLSYMGIHVHVREYWNRLKQSLPFNFTVDFK